MQLHAGSPGLVKEESGYTGRTKANWEINCQLVVTK